MSDRRLPADALVGVPLRVSAEIGRARMPVRDVVALGDGEIVELDRRADDLADLYVSGRRFGSGRLVLVDGEWALQIVSIGATRPRLEPASSDPADG